MSSEDKSNKIDFTVDQSNLYREDSVTDIKVAAIRRLTPIKPDGSDDNSRDPIFMGQTHLMSPSGPILLQSVLEARNLETAMEKFPAAMQLEMEKAMAEAQKKATEEG